MVSKKWSGCWKTDQVELPGLVLIPSGFRLRVRIRVRVRIGLGLRDTAKHAFVCTPDQNFPDKPIALSHFDC